jgi:HK97 family phage prohead protease
VNDKPTGREFRVASDTWPSESVELRAEGDGMTFSGYAAVFNSWSEDLGGFRERIDPRAFDATLKQDRAVKMFWNHNADFPLGSTRANLSLAVDDRGLLATAKLPDTTHGRDMATLVREGIVDSMSFGFQARKDEWPTAGERILLDIRLFEVSPVTGWPAYPKTSASVRELASEIDAEPDALAEAFAVLRDTDAKLTDEQQRLLVTLINARYGTPVRRAIAPQDEAKLRAFEKALA